MIENDIENVKKYTDSLRVIEMQLSDLLKKKRIIEEQIVDLTLAHIDPLKERLAHIDSEISTIALQSGIDTFKNDVYSLSVKDKLTPKIVDMVALLNFALIHPSIIKSSEFINTTKLNSFIKDGIIPDGVDVSKSFKKVSFRKV